MASVWNPNAWHWEEKNWSSWAKDYLKEAFSNQTVQSLENGGVLKTEYATVSGEAYVNIRKGKKKLGYDLKLSVELQGTIPSSSENDEDCTKMSGTFRIPEICDDTDVEDFKVEIEWRSPTGDTSTDEGKSRLQTIRSAMLEAKPKFLEKVSEFITALGEK